MNRTWRWSVALAGIGLALSAALGPAWAGRVYRGDDTAFELNRVVSQFQGRTTEAIAPWELAPTQPIQGETLIFGMSNLFPESIKIQTSTNNGRTFTDLQPSDFTFHATVVTPEGTQGSFTAIVIRFAADKVSLIQNKYVLFTIQPMPGPGNHGDVIEALILRAPR
jgi:hypothetical protein